MEEQIVLKFHLDCNMYGKFPCIAIEAEASGVVQFFFDIAMCSPEKQCLKL